MAIVERKCRGVHKLEVSRDSRQGATTAIRPALDYRHHPVRYRGLSRALARSQLVNFTLS